MYLFLFRLNLIKFSTFRVVHTNEHMTKPNVLGLGIHQLVKSVKEPPVDKDNKELSLSVGAFAKISTGRYRASYCKVSTFFKQ